IVTLFLQGSYRRSTAIRPHKDTRADVDLVVVTRLSQDEYTPSEAMEVFRPFLDKFYPDKYRFQGRSIGIELSYVDIDLVITSAPSESEVGILESESVITSESLEDSDDWLPVKSWVSKATRTNMESSWRLQEKARTEPEWTLSPLFIPDRDVESWEQTHPLEQIKWTWKKNRRCNGHYVNVVKALKWWRRVNHPLPKHPKGYPLEHLIGYACPDGIGSVAEGVTKTLETITCDPDFGFCAALKISPSLADHGVPEHNVFARVPGEDFAAFFQQAKEAAVIARHALDAESVEESAAGWRKLFGNKFPEPPNGNKGGYTPRSEKSILTSARPRFA
ncbi:MAG: SMODS domain-containing nucleotidyltransferase, partial [Chloroflexota bacterium]